MPDDDVGVVKKMIDYLYLLDYRSNSDTDICMVLTEPAAAANLAIEDVEDVETLEDIVRLKKGFPQYDVRKCFKALIENDFDYVGAHGTLFDGDAKEQRDRAYCSKRKRDAEAPV